MSSDSEVDEELVNESVSEAVSHSRLSDHLTDHEYAGEGNQEEQSSDNDNDEAEEPLHDIHRQGGRQNRAMVLRDFFRLIAGPRLTVQGNAADNSELVNILKELHVVRSARVEKALLMCPRGAFIPPDYSDDAYFDAPIRVEDMEFNISAPHMHATCLEALELQRGEKFLDIGSGCGIVAACGAFLVGNDGEVVGAEIKQQILDFSISCVQKLQEENPSYAQDSCEIQFVLKNAFMPTLQKDYYDKIHVGGTCPEERLPNLISMLSTNHGKMTVPVGQELRLITRKPDRGVDQRVLTQVRFSDLTVPSDADIVLSAMHTEAKDKMFVPIPPSTLQEDTKLVRCISGVTPNDSDVMEEDSSSIVSPAKSDMKGKVKRSISSFLGLKHNKEEFKKPTGSRDVCLDLVHFAEPDCVLVGEECTFSTHRAVLKARCDYFRARFDSEMQDAGDEELSFPSQFTQDAMSLFLQYVYKDELPEPLKPDRVIDVLHVACYYGVPRLISLCQHLLAKELKTQHENGLDTAAEFSVKLLSLADANGLTALQKAVIQYIVNHYDEVSETEAYAELTKREVDLIMKESFSLHQRFKGLLKELSETTALAK